MEKKMAKLLIQLFAEEEESETTDNMDEELDEVENEEEYTDSEETSQEEEVETPAPKTFTQEELDTIVENRLKRERKRLDKEYNSKLSKYEELAYLTREGLKAENDEDALEKTRNFYGKQGIKYTPGRSAREEEILASAEAQDILDNCDSTDDIEKEIKRILSKGTNATDRETLIAQKLNDELTLKVRASELEKIGVKEEIYNSAEFKKFEKQFTKETPIADIYELYRSKTTPKKEVYNPGSMKTTAGKEKKKFISEAEYDKMSDKEIEENLKLIEESMTQW
jgi:hypothetical protein